MFVNLIATWDGPSTIVWEATASAMSDSY